MNPKLTNNINKTDSSVACQEIEACVYDHRFKIHHCPRAFSQKNECVYCLCGRCHTEDSSDDTKGRSHKKQQKSSIDVGKGCQHDLADLKLEDNELMLAWKSLAQKGKTIPEKCSKCGKFLLM